MDDEESSAIAFRRVKRRKIGRKTHDVDRAQEMSLHEARNAAMVVSEQTELLDHGGLISTAKKMRGGHRKLGIGFSSTDRASVKPETNGEQTLALRVGEAMLEAPQIDRFVKPTGRVVVEDKHMMAYVDSKLAENRTEASSRTDTRAENTTNGLSEPHGQSNEDEPNEESRSASGSMPQAEAISTLQSAQQRSRSAYKRPTRRRQPRARPEADIARDSMIDQILSENQVPHYDRSAPAVRVNDGEEVDNDTAAAEDFKAQLLADLERNKRRPPLAKTAASVAMGPKLGGSRSQRERMRAVEDAKAGASKK